MEVLLKDDVEIDLKKMEDVIDKQKLSMSVGPFDHVEEIFMIYGLPLTTDVAGMRDRIKESVEPFVRDIVSIEPSKFYDDRTLDFF